MSKWIKIAGTKEPPVEAEIYWVMDDHKRIFKAWLFGGGGIAPYWRRTDRQFSSFHIINQILYYKKTDEATPAPPKEDWEEAWGDYIGNYPHQDTDYGKELFKAGFQAKEEPGK